MRRSASILAIVAIIGSSLALAEPSRGNSHCWFDRLEGKKKCQAEGTIRGDDRPPTGERIGRKLPAPPPFRYLQVVGGCYQWSRFPPGLDTRGSSFNEDDMFAIIFNTPRCPPVVGEPASDRAWSIFRSFPLASPDPTLNPTSAGITGYPTYLAATNPTAINHSEVLGDGTTLEVRALVTLLSVDWGDGWSLDEDPALALPYPSGAVIHVYTTKTCTAEYRETHPSGRNCHATLEAYPVTATYTWFGEYRNGGAWISIGTLDLNATILYDVDEVFGVLVDP